MFFPGLPQAPVAMTTSNMIRAGHPSRAINARQPLSL